MAAPRRGFNKTKLILVAVAFALALSYMFFSGSSSKTLSSEDNVDHKQSDKPGVRGPRDTSVQLAGEVIQDANTFRVQFDTTKGPLIVTVHRDWAPLGAARLYELVQSGFYNNPIAFFRTIPRFMLQFGINGDPAVSAIWRSKEFRDDPSIGHSNTPGMLTFAHAGPNTRSTQLFFNIKNNHYLDKDFPPIGQVDAQGLEILMSMHMTGEGAPSGSGPNQGKIQREGNEYLKREFPQLDYITGAKLLD